MMPRRLHPLQFLPPPTDREKKTGKGDRGWGLGLSIHQGTKTDQEALLEWPPSHL